MTLACSDILRKLRKLHKLPIRGYKLHTCVQYGILDNMRHFLKRHKLVQLGKNGFFTLCSQQFTNRLYRSLDGPTGRDLVLILFKKCQIL